MTKSCKKIKTKKKAEECSICGTPFELIRPEKLQPVCICHLICDSCGGRIVLHHYGEDPNYPTMSGYWCPQCGI